MTRIRTSALVIAAAGVLLSSQAIAGTRASSKILLPFAAASSVETRDSSTAERPTPRAKKKFGLIGGGFLGLGGIIAAVASGGSKSGGT